MFGKNKVLTREYMQKYKAKIESKIPKSEKETRKRLIREINEKIIDCIKCDINMFTLNLSPLYHFSIAPDLSEERYRKIMLKLIREYGENGVRVTEEAYCEFTFDLNGVFGNDN